MANTQIMIELSIFGDSFIPNDLTKLLNVKSTSAWQLGDIIPDRINKFRKETAWRFSTGYLPSVDVDELIEEHLSVFYDKTDLIYQFMQKYGLRAKVFLVVDIHKEQRPCLYFDSRFIKFLYEIGAEIDCDIY